MCAKMGRPVEWTEERIAKEADDFLEWAKKPDSYSFEKFCCYRKEPYNRQRLYELTHQNKHFADVFLTVKDMVRQNREEACANNKFNTAVYNRTASFYDREQSLTNETLSGHIKDMDRAKRDAVKDDTIDTLKEANNAIQGSFDDK